MKETKGGWKYALLFLVIYISALLTAGILFSIPDDIAFLDHQYFLVTFPSFVSIILVSLASKFWNGWSWKDLGFSRNGIIKDLLHGTLLASALLIAGSLVLYYTSLNQWTISGIDPVALFFPVLIFIAVAFGEEIIFRGYILNNLLYSFSPATSVILSALIFSLFHSLNPSITFLSIINIFSGGVLLGLTYMYKRSLWMPIGFHFSWNFVQGPILGYPVSGLNFPSLFKQRSFGPEILTGGTFGFEGSILQLVVCILGMLYLSFRKQN